MKHSDANNAGSEDHVLVTSAKQFAQVLRSGRFGRRAYAKLLGHQLLLSTRETAPALIGTGGIFQLCEITLPEASAARAWWRSLLHGEFVDFYVADDLLPTVVVAKAAVWDALPELRMNRSRREFQTITEEAFRELVGDEASSMMNECWAMGISVRQVVKASRESGVWTELAARRNGHPRFRLPQALS